jgi:hypothetical protein
MEIIAETLTNKFNESFKSSNYGQPTSSTIKRRERIDEEIKFRRDSIRTEKKAKPKDEKDFVK